MIQEMMEKLLAEAKEEADKKAFCDKEMAETKAEQKTADEIRASEKAAWAEAKSDFEQGLEGVQMALQVLRDYYAQKDDATELLQGGDSDDLGAAMSLAQ